MIENKIEKLELVDWRKLEALQPAGIKHVINYAHIEKSIIENGFAFPFGVWEDNGVLYAIDGHTRKDVLNNMDGVPDKLPAVFITADTRAEAIKILLDVYNQKQNSIDQNVLAEWLEVEEIEPEEIAVESLNMISSRSDVDYSEYNREIDIDDFEDKMTIKLEYNSEEYEKVKTALAEKGQTAEKVLFDALGLKKEYE